MSTIYCISLESETVGGVQWYRSKADRDAALRDDGVPGYMLADMVPFEFEADEGLSHDEITERADELMWEGAFLPDTPATPQEAPQ